MPKRFLRVIWLIQLTFVLFCQNIQAGGELRAYVDKTRVAVGETIQLTLEAAKRVRSELDTGPLEKDFEVFSTSKGSNINVINGKIDYRTTWTLSLSPIREGVLQIPELEVDGMRSSPINITVTQSPVSTSSSESEDGIFIDTKVEPDFPYVQQQAIVTIRLYYGSELREGSLGALEVDDAIVHKFGEDKTYEAEKNGRRYNVMERKYLVSFQTDGDHLIKGIVFDGKMIDLGQRHHLDPFGSLFNRDFFDGLNATKRVRIRGKDVTVQVLPRPASISESNWLPAKSLQLSEKWSSDKKEFNIGDPITRTVTIEAEGLTGDQLPDLADEQVDGFRVYPDKAEADFELKDERIIGKRTRKIAYIPSMAGNLTIPAIRVDWWDIEEKKVKSARLPERTVTILGAAVQSDKQNDNIKPPAVSQVPEVENQPGPSVNKKAGASSIGPQPKAGNLGWLLAVSFLSTGWAVTLFFVWRQRRNVNRFASISSEKDLKSANEKRVLARLLEVCKNNDPRAARNYLLHWSALLWPGDVPAGLDELGERFVNGDLTRELVKLDRVLYGGIEENNWEGTKLARLIKELAENKKNKEKGDKNALSPLYE